MVRRDGLDCFERPRSQPLQLQCLSIHSKVPEVFCGVVMEIVQYLLHFVTVAGRHCFFPAGTRQPYPNGADLLHSHLRVHDFATLRS